MAKTKNNTKTGDRFVVERVDAWRVVDTVTGRQLRGGESLKSATATAARENGLLTRCCRAYASVDEHGTTYCKACYRAV